MKKLVIALVAATIAVATQAATVNWGGAIDGPAVGDVAMLLWSDSAFSGAATSIDGTAVGATANNGGSVVSTYTLTASDIDPKYEFASTYNTSGSVDGYYAILISNAAGTSASYMDMGQISGTTAMSAPTSLQFNSGWTSDSDSLTMGGYTVAVSAVPEPTSGLLLLLGMAGLALKRKRA